MNTGLDPIISEFQTEEEAASYERWFKAKVQEALDSKTPRLPHDQAVARAQAMIEERKKARARSLLVR